MRGVLAGVAAGVIVVAGAPSASADYAELIQKLDPVHVVTVFDHGCSVCAGTVDVAVGTRYQTSVVVYYADNVFGGGAGGSSAGPASGLTLTIDWVNVDSGRTGTASTVLAGRGSVPIEPGAGRIAATLRVDAPHLPGGGTFEVR